MSNASLSRPYKGIFQLSFPKSIYNLVQIKQQMCPVIDQYSSITADSIRLKGINFSKEPWDMDNNSIANNTLCPFMDNSRWDKMKSKFIAFSVIDGVSSICSPL